MPYLIPDLSRSRCEIVIHHLDDEPCGIRMATSPASDMVVFAAPWARVDELRRNLGTVTVAAYLLAGGGGPDGPIRKLYIGETGTLRHRLSQHAANPAKAYVSTAYVIASRAQDFNKADVQALQFVIDAEAEQAERVIIDRGVKPMRPELSDERWAAVNRSFADVRRLLVNLGCHVLEPIVSIPLSLKDRTVSMREKTAGADATCQIEASAAADEPGWSPSDDGFHSDHATVDRSDRRRPIDINQFHHGRSLLPQGRATAEARALDAAHASRFLYRLNHGGVVAEGYQDAQQFVVIPGSTMRREHAQSFADQKDNITRRSDIFSMGITRPLPDQPGLVALTREHRFRTRAIAAKVLVGVNIKADTWVPIPLPASLNAVQSRSAAPPG
jgi:hypothetical protein